MIKFFKGICLWGGIIVTFLPAQDYPADSLLSSPETSLTEAIGILPIALWQRFTYNSKAMNCQFYPSCSNYGAQAIQTHGLLRGSVMAADRIVRCNPAALHYHLELRGDFHAPDGRLADPVTPVTEPSSSKSPVAAALISTALPGAGRVYAGRFFDGLAGFMLTALSASVAWRAHQQDKSVKATVFTGITLIVWSGEIYGAYRTAKYYQPPDG